MEEKILNHEEQLSKLLDLGLLIHPLEKDYCWEIFASTKEKAKQRFKNIKKVFPKAIHIKVNNPMDCNFGVNLYGEEEL